MSNDPPERTRAMVRIRAHQRCERCLVPAAIGHIHHRRSRSVRDKHRHCCCNLVWLCPTCHAEVHAHPFEARADGWIVSRHIETPSAVPLITAIGERILHCTGGFTFREVQSTEE